MLRIPEDVAAKLVESREATLSGFVVATDGRPDSDGAVRVGLALARRDGVKADLFSAIEPPPFVDLDGTPIPDADELVAIAREARGTMLLAQRGRATSCVLRLAGAVERSSGHLLARTLVEAAEATGLELPAVSDVIESPGRGVTGTVDGHRVVVGARAFVLDQTERGEAALRGVEPNGAGLRAYVATDGAIAGIIEYADALRPGVSDVFRELTDMGVRRIMLLSGDHAENARTVAAAAGIVEVQGDLLPEDKVAVVRALVQTGESVLMVGDGTNDAPALSAATVGVALAGHGGGITAEAADVVILIDDLSRVVEAMRVSRRTMHIARQCIAVGLGLSAVGMVAAAMGALAPTTGALLQEGIDLAVIVNALRASR